MLQSHWTQQMRIFAVEAQLVVVAVVSRHDVVHRLRYNIGLHLLLLLWMPCEVMVIFRRVADVTTWLLLLVLQH